MKLRELLEKATGGNSAENYNAKLKLQRLLYECVPELLDVAEAAEKEVSTHSLMEYDPPIICTCSLCAALRKLKEKEEIYG